MEIRPVGAKLFHSVGRAGCRADWSTDRQDDINPHPANVENMVSF